VTAVALAGWSVAALLAARAADRDRRLGMAGDAEHELRGALTVFGLALERLDRGGPSVRRDLESELERARAGLADLAAARGARSRPAAEPVDLERLARSAVAAWRPAAQCRRRRVDLDWRAGTARVQADRGRLAQALGNLLANAVEHGTGTVRIVARRRGGAVRVEIVNGLRAGAKPVAAGPPAAGRGRGLGIAARAIELCGGSLTVGSRRGSVAAGFELPLAR
jgi:signal transduction histidine kinase